MLVKDKGNPSALTQQNIIKLMDQRQQFGPNTVRFWEETNYVKSKLQSQIPSDILMGIRDLSHQALGVWSNPTNILLDYSDQLPTPNWLNMSANAQLASTHPAWTDVAYKSLITSTYRPWYSWKTNAPKARNTMAADIPDITWHAMERGARYFEAPAVQLLRRDYRDYMRQIILPGTTDTQMKFDFWDNLPEPTASDTNLANCHSTLAIQQKQMGIEKQLQDFTSVIKSVVSSPLNSVTVDGETKVKKNIKTILINLLRVSYSFRYSRKE